MKYFVTGATGFIGGRLAELLIDDGHSVVALVRTPTKATKLQRIGVEIAAGDITDKESLRKPMTGADGVFHVAAWYKIGERNRAADEINVRGTKNVLDVMADLGIPKGVYTSSLAVNSDTKGVLVDESYRYSGPHISEYDRTKWEAHWNVAIPMMRDGLPLVIVMPGIVYGPGDQSVIARTFADLVKGKMPLMPLGSRYCWAHVDDIARAHVLAMEKGKSGESYIIAGPPHDMEDALAVVARIAGVKLPRIKAGPPVIKAMAWVTDKIAKVLPVPASYHPESLRAVAGVSYIGDNAKARRELGFSPRSLEDGLPETIADIQAGIRPKK